MNEPEAEHQVWFLALDDADPHDIAQAFPRGSELALQLAGASAVDVDGRRKAIAHAVLRLLLARWIGFEAALQTFALGYAGKPHLARTPAHGPVDFSLSHSGAAALIGLARQCCIGVDIEHPRRVSIHSDRRKKIISVAEAISGASLSETGETDAAVSEAWVRLEAAAKATGEGMGRLLTRYQIVGVKADFAEVSQSMAARETLHIQDLRLPMPYLGAMATTVAVSRRPVEIFGPSADAISALFKSSD